MRHKFNHEVNTMKTLLNSKKATLLAVCLTCLLATDAVASELTEKAYLYVFFLDDSSTGERFRTAMPNMKPCLESLKYAKMPMPTNPSGDYEVIGAMWCGTEEFNRNYSATWWDDGVKKSSSKD